MDRIPEELLSTILTMYISSKSQEDTVSLGELRNRVLTASLVSKFWKHVVLDTRHSPATVHTRMNLEELSKLSEYHRSDNMAGFALSSESSTRKLFSRVRGVTIQDGTRSDTIFPKIVQGIHVVSAFANHISYLCVDLPESCRNTSNFDCSILDAFPMLEELRLQKFKTIENLKQHFPKHIKRLQIEYGEIWERDILHSHSISIFDLPSHAQLDFCRIQKSGTVGVISRQIINQIRECHINSLFLLMSVAVDDVELIELFQKPYKEGAYVPPHILGDWEVVEMSHRATDSACTLLLEYLSASSLLRKLTIVGEACQSLKIIPSISMSEPEDLYWISGITEQASSLLYGMSGEEFQERLELLQMMKLSNTETTSSRYTMNNLHVSVCEEQRIISFLVE